jgi:hypothetical protein
MANQDNKRVIGPRFRFGLMEPVRLASLGTATYLSYWSLFFAVCRACSGRQLERNA